MTSPEKMRQLEEKLAELRRRRKAPARKTRPADIAEKPRPQNKTAQKAQPAPINRWRRDLVVIGLIGFVCFALTFEFSSGGSIRRYLQRPAPAVVEAAVSPPTVQSTVIAKQMKAVQAPKPEVAISQRKKIAAAAPQTQKRLAKQPSPPVESRAVAQDMQVAKASDASALNVPALPTPRVEVQLSKPKAAKPVKPQVIVENRLPKREVITPAATILSAIEDMPSTPPKDVSAQSDVVVAAAPQKPLIVAPKPSGAVVPNPVADSVPEQAARPVDPPLADTTSAPAPVTVEMAFAQPNAVPAVATPKPSAPPQPPPAPKYRQADVLSDCNGCPDLIAVSAGTYLKANETDPNAQGEAATFDHSFGISRFEITFEDWDRCVADQACNPVVDDGGFGRGKRPIINVSFDDVTKQYLPWLSRLTRQVYRLPTPQEWEYAFIGGAGAQSAGLQEKCSNMVGGLMGQCSDHYPATAPVGSFVANALGLHDMQGNVWEWVDACWRPFTYGAAKNTETCEARVILGGAWSSDASSFNPLTQGWEKAGKARNTIGFRVARSLP